MFSGFFELEPPIKGLFLLCGLRNFWFTKIINLSIFKLTNTYEVSLTACYSASCYLSKSRIFLFRGNSEKSEKANID